MSMMVLFGLLVHVVAHHSSIPSEADPLHKVLNAATIYESIKKDEFAEPPNLGGLNGASFVAKVPLHSFRSTQPASRLGSGTYDYKEGVLKTYLSLDFDGSKWTVVVDEPVIRPGKSFHGANSFGVGRTVTVEYIYRGGFKINNLRPAKEYVSTDWFHFSQSASGDEARTLAHGLQYEFSGTLTGYDPTHSVTCKRPIVALATLDDPSKLVISQCIVGALVSEVRLVNRLSHKVVAVWRIDPASGQIGD